MADKQAIIPDGEFMCLLKHLQDYVDDPENKAKRALARESVVTLQGYSPSLVEEQTSTKNRVEDVFRKAGFKVVPIKKQNVID